MHIEFSSDWFAVQVKPQAEYAVASSLQSKGFESFLPSYCVKSPSEGRQRNRQRVLPLFPGYVFFRLSHEKPGSIVTTPGVIRILGTGNGPSKIDDSEMSALRRFAELMMNPEPLPYFQVGQSICIREGPLAGVKGIILKRRTGHRLVVSVTLLQRSVAVDVDSDWLTSPEESRPLTQPESLAL